jgi:hypothetical protein
MGSIDTMKRSAGSLEDDVVDSRKDPWSALTIVLSLLQ